MGICLTNKEKEVSMGYIGFALIRRSIAKAYDKSISDLYEMMYSPLFKGYTDEENKLKTSKYKNRIYTEEELNERIGV